MSSSPDAGELNLGEPSAAAAEAAGVSPDAATTSEAAAQLLERVQQCRHLPSPPAVAMRVLELVESEHCSAEEIGALITQDPALAGKLLKTVNSAFYGRTTPVATVPQAVVILGLQSVQTLVLGFSLITDLRKHDKHERFNHSLFWQRSIYGATAARLIAVEANVREVEEAFLGALLRDIGMLALDCALGNEYGDVLGRAQTSDQIIDAELDAFGCTHADLGGALATSWKLPPSLIEPIRNHHGNDEADGTGPHDRLCDVIELADQLAETFVLPDGEEQRVALAGTEAATRLDLGPAALASVGSQIQSQAIEVATLYEVNLNEVTRYEAILNQANDRLVDRTLRSQAEATQLQEQAAQMQEKAATLEITAAKARETAAAMKLAASTDALTGLLNRGQLDQQFATLLAAAVRQRQPLAVAMFDLDKFKALNDTHGHPAGDAVLKHVARILKSMCGDKLIPARYGGEEMTIVMPACDRAVGLPICERIRKRIEQSTIRHEGVSLSVTASIGLAAYEPTTGYKIFAKPSVLLKAADLALYHAKQSGRNRTKVCLLPDKTPTSNAA
ncbi:MAG: GGDEF domain-containing protein [Planctomycetota bacterium]